MRPPKLSVLILAVVVPTTGTGAAWRPNPSWQLTETGVTSRLRGLAPVDSRGASASGSDNTVLRTVDGGRSWQRVGPTGVEPVPQFRDIAAFDGYRAVILSIGSGGESRVYRTDDGGRHWTETFRNEDEQAFHDCLAFFDDRRDLALSDPVDGRFRILSTADGGRSWSLLPDAGMQRRCPASSPSRPAAPAWSPPTTGRPGRHGSPPAAARPPGCSARRPGAHLAGDRDHGSGRRDRRHLHPGLPRLSARRRARRRLPHSDRRPGRRGGQPGRRSELDGHRQPTAGVPLRLDHIGGQPVWLVADDRHRRVAVLP
ncbi:hypothetical protein [Micromonospora sp. NPDC023633]|uniref:WD40/YVTN/BNR-like repeat-containing protein n=1 Tax=Micromonospora sp. NPDC023633 TaxID=3154320 RepID=UPI0033D7AF11